eukprot:sb/3475381/
MHQKIDNFTSIVLEDYEAGYIGLPVSRRSFFEKLAWVSLSITTVAIAIGVCRCLVGATGTKSRFMESLVSQLLPFLQNNAETQQPDAPNAPITTPSAPYSEPVLVRDAGTGSTSALYPDLEDTKTSE